MFRMLLRKISRLVRYRKIEATVVPLLFRPLSKAFRRRRYRKWIRHCAAQPTPPVLVYTMSKVASTAVTEALQSVGGLNVFQIHIISEAGMQRLSDGMKRRGLKSLKRDMGVIQDLGHALDEELIKRGHPAKVVALIREPIARNVSFYFQTLDVLWQTENAHEKVALDRLLAEFHDRFPHERVLDWFDKEFNPTLGIDVYAHPFPREAGFLRIDSGPYEVLLMRHDLDDRVKEKCLADLVGVPRVPLAPKNVGAEKPYSKTYDEFLRHIRASEDYVERMLSSKYARHFYAAEELERVRAKWLGTGQVEAAAAVSSVASVGTTRRAETF
jgi:putative capsular polysaccharide synthesis protein